MKKFEWANPTTISHAIQLLKSAPMSTDIDEAARPIAGGQDLLTTMKDYTTRPTRLVNLKGIRGLDRIQGNSKTGLTIGALVTLAQLEDNLVVRTGFPGLAQAAHSIATPQIRNLATVGGNLCQRPRCWYFRLEEVICLKKGGTECYASTVRISTMRYSAVVHHTSFTHQTSRRCWSLWTPGFRLRVQTVSG